MLALIWAQDENGMIGHAEGFEGMPWHLPNDLKFFSRITKQGDIAMGRTTYELMTKTPLPGRKNIVLTSNKDYQAPGALVVHDKQDILDYAEQSDKTLFITGGASVYDQFVEDADLIYRTVVHDTFQGDTFIPDMNWEEWELVRSEEGVVDENNSHAHTFELYQRKG